MSPFTSAQEAFLAQMRMNNTDERAMRVIEAAFRVRNAHPVSMQIQALREASDKVAG